MNHQHGLRAILANLSKLAEDHEDKDLKLMPIKPKTIQESVYYVDEDQNA